MNWKTIEMLGYSYYASKGYNILIKLVSNSHYDFVIEKNGNFKRVNVKLAGRKDPKRINSWAINTSGNYDKKKINALAVDLFLVWMPEHRKFITLPGDFFKGSKSKCKLIPKKYVENLLNGSI